MAGNVLLFFLLSQRDTLNGRTRFFFVSMCFRLLNECVVCVIMCVHQNIRLHEVWRQMCHTQVCSELACKFSKWHGAAVRCCEHEHI